MLGSPSSASSATTGTCTQQCNTRDIVLTPAFPSPFRYTHYFYRVLKADYTFPAHRLNDVPICLYFMTHAYFMVS